MDGKAAVIQRLLAALAADNAENARAIARTEYAFSSMATVGRVYTPEQMMKVFISDGFIDRYSGRRLVFPGVLRLPLMATPN
jgi:hypothetical protein